MACVSSLPRDTRTPPGPCLFAEEIAIMDVRIAEIVIPPGRRAVSDTSVNALKNSIEQVGLLQAILLTPDLRLVAGAHRVAACKLLGHETIRAEIVDLGDLDRELAEIDENLIRNELTALERGEHLARRKAIYEALHPETRQGGLPGAPGGGKQAKTETISGFAEDAAEKTGVTDRAIRYAVQIGEDITPEARDAIRETPTADNQADLLRLAKLPEDEQVAVAHEVRDTGKTVKQVELERKREAVDEQTRGQNLTALVSLANQTDWLPAVCGLTGRFGPADLLLTDPPYSTDVEDIGTFAADWLPSALACVKDTGRAYVFIGAYPLELLSYLAVGLADERMVLEQVLVWTYRNTLGPSPTHTYKQNWQACLYFVGPEAPPLDCPLMNEQFSVQDVNAPDGRRGDRYHAWQKPDDLAERLVRHSTQPGDLVIDPFCGTGTFVLAAARLGRRGWGCDSDISMIDIALQRGCQNRDVTRERAE